MYLYFYVIGIPIAWFLFVWCELHPFTRRTLIPFNELPLQALKEYYRYDVWLSFPGKIGQKARVAYIREKSALARGRKGNQYRVAKSDARHQTESARKDEHPFRNHCFVLIWPAYLPIYVAIKLFDLVISLLILLLFVLAMRAYENEQHQP